MMEKNLCMKLERLIELVIPREYDNIVSIYVERIHTMDDKKVCLVYYSVGNDWDHNQDEHLRRDTFGLYKMLNPAHNEGIQINID